MRISPIKSWFSRGRVVAYSIDKIPPSPLSAPSPISLVPPNRKPRAQGSFLNSNSARKSHPNSALDTKTRYLFFPSLVRHPFSVILFGFRIKPSSRTPPFLSYRVSSTLGRLTLTPHHPSSPIFFLAPLAKSTRRSAVIFHPLIVRWPFQRLLSWGRTGLILAISVAGSSNTSGPLPGGR